MENSLLGNHHFYLFIFSLQVVILQKGKSKGTFGAHLFVCSCGKSKSARIQKTIPTHQRKWFSAEILKNQLKFLAFPGRNMAAPNLVFAVESFSAFRGFFCGNLFPMYPNMPLFK